MLNKGDTIQIHIRTHYDINRSSNDVFKYSHDAFVVFTKDNMLNREPYLFFTFKDITKESLEGSNNICKLGAKHFFKNTYIPSRVKLIEKY